MLVDKNIELLEDIEKAGKTLQKATKYIESLEDKLAKDKQDQSVMTDTEYITNLNMIQGTLYKPSVRYLRSESKCNNCDSNGYISVQDDFYNHRKLCTCQLLKPLYDCKEIDVISTSYITNNMKTYDCREDDKVYSVNAKFVFDKFDTRQLSMNIDSVYYINQKDCFEFCRRKNDET